KEIEEIRALSMCPLCKQDVHPAHKSNIIGENQKTIDKTQIELESLKLDIEESEKKILLLRKKANELINEKEKLNYFEKNYAELKNEEKQLEEEKQKIIVLAKEKTIIDLDLKKIDKFDAGKIKEKVEEIERKIIDFEKEKKDILRRNDLVKFIDEKKKNMQNILEAKIKTAKSITDLTKSIHILTKETALYDRLESDIQKIKEEKEVLLSILENQKIALAQIKEKINSFEMQNADILKKIDILSLSKRKYEKINQIVNWIDNLYIPMLKNIERNVLARIHFEFEGVFSKWFDLLINNNFFNIYIDEDFNPIIEQYGFDIDFDNLSGGEQTAVGLCYRLALNQVINNITKHIKTKDVIILDEPTDGFSEEQLEQLGVVINNLNLSQVIIVSHESKLRSFANSILYLKKEDNNSFITNN
ncbi:MAG: hypothetical protein KAI55_02980, partial [Candidatus Aenigmarchaeota archaeon]|nr:hypothetical protein [Candidatus Aenigmarchaeota archaeon]